MNGLALFIWFCALTPLCEALLTQIDRESNAKHRKPRWW